MPNQKAGKPCQTCKAGDCADCLNSPENSTPVKLYTPKGAIRAMLAGKSLEDSKGNFYQWDKEQNNFICFKADDLKELPNKAKRCPCYPVTDFTGLFEEIE